MPPPYVWTARSWPQQKVEKGKKKQWFTVQAGKSREPGCHSAPTDSCRCKAGFCLLIFSSFFVCYSFSSHGVKNAKLGEIIEGNYRLLEITRFFWLAVKSTSVSVFTSSLLIFSTLISLLGQNVISSPVLSIAVSLLLVLGDFTVARTQIASGAAVVFSTKWVHLLSHCHPSVSNN